MRTRLLGLVGSAALVLPIVLGSVGVARAAPSTSPAFILVRGVTAPVHDYADAIRETVWVTAPDLDGDGVNERVATDIIRPRELDGVARVPVVMDASPYYLSLGRGNESEHKSYDADGNPVTFPLFYDNYFVPRGYAFVAVDMAGTARSTGCSDEGGVSDIESVKAVIQWLNGNGVAHAASGNVVTATWSNGRTAMIGKSYDGTLANGVAATGVDGLKTIVPIGAISSWYDYNRWQGAVKSYDYPSELSELIAANRTIPTDCSARLTWMNANDGDETGAYTDFWAERDYRAGSVYDASQVKASVFIVHGLQDDNVKTMNASKWWEALGAQGVTRKMWLTRFGHVDPFDTDRAEWVDVLHRWFDHELMGIENGILDEPAVNIETAPNQWQQARTWPITAARSTTLNFQSDGTMTLGQRDGSTTGYINSPSLSGADAVKLGDNPNRLLFLTGTTKREVRISGTPSVDLNVTHASPVGQLSVMLVDYGQMDRISVEGEGARTLQTQSCWGLSTADDDACYFDVAPRVDSTALQVLARGWIRLAGAGNHNVMLELSATDITVPAGHQLGIVISGSSDGVVALDTAATKYTLGLSSSRLNLPVAGPMSGFGPGHITAKDTQNLPPGTVSSLNEKVWPDN